MAVVQYLSKYLFDKYEDKANFDASDCGLPVITSMNTYSLDAMVDDANITLIILNCSLLIEKLR